MRRVRSIVFLCLIAVGIAASLLLVASKSTAQETSALDTSRQTTTIMMRCVATSDFRVVAFKGSTGATSQKGSDCPEVLSWLAREGYTIRDSAFSLDADYVVYTLVR